MSIVLFILGVFGSLALIHAIWLFWLTIDIHKRYKNSKKKLQSEIDGVK